MEGADMADDQPDAKHIVMESIGRISSLPDSIILHILSFLPMVDAIKAAESLRLQDFWTCLREITFDECDWHICSGLTKGGRSFEDVMKFVESNNCVLAMHNGPAIDRFLLNVDASSLWNADKMLVKEIANWINFAISKKAKILDLDFLGCRDGHNNNLWREFPVSISGSHLVELRLTSCKVRKVQFESLRKLFLTSIPYSGEETMAGIFSGCPKLEELSICGGWNLTYLKVPEQHPLKKLYVKLDRLETVDLGRSNVKEIILVASPEFRMLNCRNVTDLHISGHLHHVCLKDAGFVNHAAIHLWKPPHSSHPFCLYLDMRDCCKRIVEEEFPNLKLLLEKLRHCSQFQLCTWTISVLSIWEIRERRSLSYDWKHVTALLALTKWIKPGLCRLLRQCAHLETLTVYFYPCCDRKRKVFEKKMREAYGFNEGNCGSLFKGSYGCLGRHLRKVTVQGFVTDPLSIQFIVLLLGYALKLEELVISGRKTFGESMNRYLLLGDEIRMKKEGHMHNLSPQFCQQILEIPRVSSSLVIRFE